jgi:hypothetical protein
LDVGYNGLYWKSIIIGLGGLNLRTLTMDEIKSKIASRGQAVDLSVNKFRKQTKESGWVMKRARPRDPDEIKALNQLALQTMRRAIKDGSFRYDKESRVLDLAQFRRS